MHEFPKRNRSIAQLKDGNFKGQSSAFGTSNKSGQFRKLIKMEKY